MIKIRMLATSWKGKTYWARELYLMDCSLAHHFLDKKIAIPIEEENQIDNPKKKVRKPRCLKSEKTPI